MELKDEKQPDYPKHFVLEVQDSKIGLSTLLNCTEKKQKDVIKTNGKVSS